MIRVKGYGLARGFMSEGYVENDHDAERIRVTTVPSESGGQLLELLKGDDTVAAYAPGKWISAFVVEGHSGVPSPAPRTVEFTKATPAVKERSKLVEHVVADPHSMKPESAEAYDIGALQSWHDKDHTISAINRNHTHQED